MGEKRNLRFSEELISEFYAKKMQLSKLEKELEEMTNFIKEQLENNHMYFTSNYKFNIYIEHCYKPTDDFIEVAKDRGYSHFIKESCLMKDFNLICDEVGLDKNKYRELWYKKLYVKKK